MRERVNRNLMPRWGFSLKTEELNFIWGMPQVTVWPPVLVNGSLNYQDLCVSEINKGSVKSRGSKKLIWSHINQKKLFVNTLSPVHHQQTWQRRCYDGAPCSSLQAIMSSQSPIMSVSFCDLWQKNASISMTAAALTDTMTVQHCLQQVRGETGEAPHHWLH